MTRLAATAALLALATSAVAEGAPLSLGWRGLEGLPVSRLEVPDLPSELAEELRDGLALGARRSWWRGESPLFFTGVLEEDLARTRLFLARRGHPRAVVTPQVQATSDGRTVRVTLRIEPGPAVRVGTVTLPGLPPDLVAPALPLHRGAVFRDAEAEGAAARLRRFLRDQGHAFAEVRPDVSPRDSLTMDVRLVVEAGARYRIGGVEVTGVAPDLAGLARDATELDPGEPFSPERLRTAETNLRELDLFRLIRLDLQPSGDNRLRVRCELAARLPRSFTSGIGYYSDEQVRATAEWRHRNLLRNGRGVRVAGHASRYVQSLRGDLVWPRLAGTRLRALTGAAFRREDEDAYRLVDTRFEFTAGLRLGRSSRVSSGITVGYVDVLVRTEDPTIDDPVGLLVTVPFALARDTSDDPVSPTRGNVLRLDLEGTPPGLGSVTDYVRAEGRAAVYLPGPGSSVLASRLLVGTAIPFGDTEHVLANRRMYSGGSRSMRGYGRRRLGPLADDGEPIGGEAKVEASTEWRFPILGRLAGALFVDGGQVWADRDGLDASDLRWAVGPALMVRSPVGPLRLDMGFPLGDRGDEPARVFHFSVGHPY